MVDVERGVINVGLHVGSNPCSQFHQKMDKSPKHYCARLCKGIPSCSCSSNDKNGMGKEAGMYCKVDVHVGALQIIKCKWTL